MSHEDSGAIGIVFGSILVRGAVDLDYNAMDGMIEVSPETSAFAWSKAPLTHKA